MRVSEMRKTTQKETVVFEMGVSEMGFKF